MNFKHSLVFFSAGIILILFLFLMGAVPMDIVLPESLQQQQEQNDETNTEMSSKGDVDEGGQQLTTTTEEEENIIIPTKTQTKPIDQMDCTELKEFTFSFESGWAVLWHCMMSDAPN